MNRFIGLLDSGMGGLTVLNQVIPSLPEENTVHFGDMVRLRIQDIVDPSISLILFDLEEDQALDIRMSTDELTEAGLAERMAAEVPEPLYSQAVEYLSGWQLTEAD